MEQSSILLLHTDLDCTVPRLLLAKHEIDSLRLDIVWTRVKCLFMAERLRTHLHVSLVSRWLPFSRHLNSQALLTLSGLLGYLAIDLAHFRVVSSFASSAIRRLLKREGLRVDSLLSMIRTHTFL